jgi:hypothetical protein
VVALALAMVAATSARAASPCAGALANPPPGEDALPVDVGVFLVDVSQIDDVAQQYEAHFVVQLGWTDPRVAARQAAGCAIDTAALWVPPVSLVNQRERLEQMARIVDAGDAGRIGARLRWVGHLSSHFDLRRFPLDRQHLPIALVVYADDRPIELRVDADATGRQPVFSAVGWDFGAPDARVDAMETQFRGLVLPRLTFTVEAARAPGFYTWKVVFPLTLIVVMSFAVFFIDPSEFGVQIGVSTASVLTLVAFQLSLDRFLPRVAYLTRMDLFTVGATLLVFLALGEAMWTGGLAHVGRAEAGRRIDRICRPLFPLALAGLLIWFYLV